VSASLSPTPLLANETNQRNSLYLKINYRIPSFRLNIKRSGDIIASLRCRWK
jgi:hypothetical protein